MYSPLLIIIVWLRILAILTVSLIPPQHVKLSSLPHVTGMTHLECDGSPGWIAPCLEERYAAGTLQKCSGNSSTFTKPSSTRLNQKIVMFVYRGNLIILQSTLCGSLRLLSTGLSHPPEPPLQEPIPGAPSFPSQNFLCSARPLPCEIPQAS